MTPSLINFQYVDQLFDTMNSRSLFATGFKKALCKENIASVSAFFTVARQYLMSLRTLNGTSVVYCQRYNSCRCYLNMKNYAFIVYFFTC
jgi:hypothetical protein